MAGDGVRFLCPETGWRRRTARRVTKLAANSYCIIVTTAIFSVGVRGGRSDMSVMLVIPVERAH